MEEMYSQSLFSLSIDPVTKSHLTSTAKWARFLAIAGLVLLLLMILFTVTSFIFFPDSTFTRVTVNGVEQEGLTPALKVVIIVFLFIVCVIAFFPLWFLLQFANQMKRALYNNDQESLNASFLNIKKYFRYLGVITIIVLAVYGLTFLFQILAVTMR